MLLSKEIIRKEIIALEGGGDIQYKSVEDLKSGLVQQFSGIINWGKDIVKMDKGTAKNLLNLRKLLLYYIYYYALNVSESDTTAKSFGSTSLTSDIDVTINGSNAANTIATIEAFCRENGINLEALDIQLNGDRTYLSVKDDTGKVYNYFFDGTKFSVDDEKRIVEVLQLAVKRSFPSGQEPPQITTMFDLLFRAFPDRKPDDTRATESVTPNRSKYLNRLRNSERLVSSYKSMNNIRRNPNLIDIFIDNALANLYSSENYVLPSTVNYIVHITQAGADSTLSAFPNARDPAKSMTPFLYFCSAIEQLIYLLKYTNNDCKAYKYLIRMIKSLQSGDHLSDNFDTDTLQSIYDNYKSGSYDSRCDYTPVLTAIFTGVGEMYAPMAGGTRKRRQRRRRNLRKRTRRARRML